MDTISTLAFSPSLTLTERVNSPRMRLRASNLVFQDHRFSGFRAVAVACAAPCPSPGPGPERSSAAVCTRSDAACPTPSRRAKRPPSTASIRGARRPASTTSLRGAKRRSNLMLQRGVARPRRALPPSRTSATMQRPAKPRGPPALGAGDAQARSSSSRLERSSACSSSIARMPSSMRRVVTSLSPM